MFLAGTTVARPDQQQQFTEAWQAARKGDHATFEKLGPGLEDYVLYPYWQYEDYRHRRARVAPAEMAEFLAAHVDLAFVEGLRIAWLKALAKRGKWPALVEYGAGVQDVEIRCHHARARLREGQMDGLLQEVQTLWTVGKSQHDACDPVFKWLIDNDGVTPGIAWERVRLAMEAGNPRFTLYLARFLPPEDRRWLERWQELNRTRYWRLDRAASWPDRPVTRMITSVSLRRLARHDAVVAMQAFEHLDGQFGWGDDTRGDVLREIALMAAVELTPEGLGYMQRVPTDHRNEQLLQWWVRLALSERDWEQVLTAIGQMGPETAGDDRWRYWRARAWTKTGRQAEALAEFEDIATHATYHGFLAADQLQLPYAICPLEPPVNGDQVVELRTVAGFDRALELRRTGLDNWALAEWNLAAWRLPDEQLKVAAALAREENWHDRAIFALGDSGETRFYEWRFPVLWQQPVQAEADRHGLDPAWVFGVMRSESAMTETAVSSAGAMGLMQVTPGTARQISKKHGLPYRSKAQLLDGAQNIRFGTVYMRELLDRFDQNPVMVSAAYNAGPHVVDRWLNARSIDDATVWIETLPYFETRDYIPRVLAFTAIYDWRLEGRIRRVSSRMPGIESGNMDPVERTGVACQSGSAELADATR